MKKYLLFACFLFASFFAYSFVSWKRIISEEEDISFNWILWNQIYLKSDSLNSSIVSYKSDLDISNYYLSSVCDISSEFISSKDSIYYFKLVYNKDDCSNNLVYLKNKDSILISTGFSVDFFDDYEFLNMLYDYSDEDLKKINDNILKKISQYMIFRNYNEAFEIDANYFLSKKRIYEELNYKYALIDKTISSRKNKYLSPVPWYSISTLKTKVPNSKRPYRESYTDWIHHWWDIDAPKWTKVVALDDGVIIRVVDNFSFSDLEKIKMWSSLSYEDKITNLDILRWNQVWLKTSKWDVVFYSHLDSVFSDIKEWMFVESWYALWTIWASWVPDENYDDFHLHFAIQKNPYIIEKSWKYNMFDYMDWDWYFKWEDSSYIIENQKEIFEN